MQRSKRRLATTGGQSWKQDEVPELSVEEIAGKLAARGYRQIAFKRLDAGLDGIAVTKAFVPGLGSSSRTRRDTK